MARKVGSRPTDVCILLCLREECCGMDVMARVNELTGGRVAVGPGTLYNLLEQFLAAGYIVETRAKGRRRSYQLTAEGETLLQNEVERPAKASGAGLREAILRDNAPCGRENKGKRGIAMLKTKYEYNFYSFYDHTGMEQHFRENGGAGLAH